MEQNQPAKPFDEPAVLAELERLLQAIQSARQARQRKVEEFDAFTQTFRRPAAEPPVRPSPAVARAANQPVSQPAPTQGPPLPLVPSEEPKAALAHEPPATALPSEPLVPAPPTRPAARARTVVYVSAIAIATVIGLLAYGWLKGAPRSKIQAPAAANRTVPREAPSGAPAAAAAAQPAGTAHPVEIELRTVHTVWIRVVVDGRKQLETIVPGGQRLRFGGDRSVVVRAGNGADVQVTTGGTSRALGPEAQPITRTFGRE